MNVKRIGFPHLRGAGCAAFFGFAAAVVAFSICQSAYAQSDQSVAGESPALPGAESSSALSEIVVTATRRESTASKVPISISALGGAQMSAQGINDIADIAAVTPGLQFDVPNGYASTIQTLSIRGMNSQVGANVVGIYLDDTPIQSRLPAWGNTGTPIPLSFDMNRVEVERGPQGTLFGAGAEAGVVRFIPNEPSLTTESGLLQVGGSDTQNGAPGYELGAAFGEPLIQDELAMRASVWYERDGGYIDHIDPLTGITTKRNSNSSEKLAARLAVTAKLSEAIKVTPSIYYLNQHQDDSNRFYGNFYSDASAGKFINGALAPEISNDSLLIPSLKIEAALPFADLTLVSSFTDRHVSLSSDASIFYGPIFGGTVGFGSPLGPSNAVSQNDYSPLNTGQTLTAFTQEARLASNDPAAFLTWVAGLYYDHRTQDEFQGATAPAFGDPRVYSYYIRGVITDEQIAAFAQGDFHITDKLTATLGERVARVMTTETDYNGTGLLNAGEPAVGTSSAEQTPQTPRLSLSYQADPHNLFYASVAKGFRVGGGNAPLPSSCGISVAPYKPDFDWSYEVGAKSSLFSGRVYTDISVFHVNWSQIQQIVIPSCGVAYTANTGSAVVNGFNANIQASLTKQMSVNLAVGYADAYFTQDVFISPGVPLVLKGDKVGFLPQVNAPWNVDVGVNYDQPVGQNAKLYFHAEYQYNSQNPGPFITQNKDSPNYYDLIVADPATSMVKARIGYEINNLDFTFYGDNLLNAHPVLASFQFPVQDNIVTNATFRPRTCGLTVKMKF